MKVRIIIIFLCSIKCFAQVTPFNRSSIIQLQTTYKTLTNKNDSANQYAYFDAFPKNWYQYNQLIQQTNEEDLRKYCNAMSKLTAINDTVYCMRLFSLGIGANYDVDTGQYLPSLIRKKMGWITEDNVIEYKQQRNRMAYIMFWIQEQALPGDVFRFWEIYWSSCYLEEHGRNYDYSSIPEFRRLKEISEHTHPEIYKTMRIAFEYFYHKILPISSYPDIGILLRPTTGESSHIVNENK